MNLLDSPPLRSIRRGVERSCAFVRRRPVRAAALLFLICLPFRLPAAVGDLPRDYDFDEPFNMGEALRLVTQTTLKPAEQNYPSLHKYATAAEIVGLRVLGFTNDDFRWSAAAAGDTRAGDERAWYLVRALPAALGALAVALCFLAILELGAPAWAALVFAPFGVAAPLAVSQWGRVAADPWAAFFVAATVWAAARFTAREGRRDLIAAGAFAGLATASKYNAAAFVLLPGVLPVALAGWRNWRRWLPNLCLAAAAACVAFAVASPYTFLDPQTAIDGIRQPNRVYSYGRVGLEGRSLWFHLRVLIDNTTVLIPAALAAWWTGWRHDKRINALVLSVGAATAATVVIQSRYLVRIDRNMLPLLLPVGVVGAIGMWWLARQAVERPEIPGTRFIRNRALVVAVLALAIGAQMTKAVGETARVAGDERLAARDAIEGLVQPGDAVFAESYAPIPRMEGITVISKPFYQTTLENLQAEGVDWYLFSSDVYGNAFTDERRYASLIRQYRTAWDSLCPVGVYRSHGTEIRIYGANCP